MMLMDGCYGMPKLDLGDFKGESINSRLTGKKN